jgi:hypothetical protein
VSVKTDADGKFSIPLRRNERVVLVAYASRNVFKKTEEYYWIVSVSLDGKESKKILLSNDSLFDGDEEKLKSL